ncbi:MAG: M4 family metallopeptidase [Saprospiraceae bacterium]|nr:M4 family metallopeptidase [Saprospiraceae bacterium]
MKTTKLFLTLLLQVIFLSLGSGQIKRYSKVYHTRQFQNYEVTDGKWGHVDYFTKLSDKMHLGEQTEMSLIGAVPGDNGYSHYKFQQLHAGVPIFGNTYILHEKDGAVVRATGRYSPMCEPMPLPTVGPATAVMLAKKEMNAAVYGTIGEPVLYWIDPRFPGISEQLRLAYQVDVSSSEPLDRQRFFVDALNGKVLCQFPLMLHEGVPSTAKTTYYGVQDIITDKINPTLYQLHDPTRGQGITVNSPQGSVYTSNSSDWDLTNSLMDEVALDAHYCAQEYYDMMLGDYAWSGLDGNGKALILQVHNDRAGDVNAFWDGNATNYGDGNCLYGPLTTLEVVGHEFTHGMVDHTSQLVYIREPGAINESLADIFGKLLEYKTTPEDFSWDLGHSFSLSPEAKPWRVMDDPASVGMPDFYKGWLWVDGFDVHINSAVGNLWFTMVVDGKQGVNEIGQSYNVPAIGMDKAGQIVFKVNQAYLTQSSDYQAFYEYSVLAATELYGAGSVEVTAVEEAWKAVGLPVTASPGLDLTINSYDATGKFCGLNEYHPVTIEVANIGSVTYLPSMNGNLQLTDTGNGSMAAYEAAINMPIEPGEVVQVVVNDWLNYPEAGYVFVYAIIDLANDDPSNNHGFFESSIVAYDAHDISFHVSPIAGTPKCFSNELEVAVSIYNKTCEAVPAGTVMQLYAIDAVGNMFWTQNYTLDQALTPLGGIYQQFSIDISTANLSFPPIMGIQYADDFDTGNNSQPVNFDYFKTIDSDYLNDFNQPLQQDDYLEVKSLYGNPLVLYQGEQYFSTWGNSFFNVNIMHCPNFEDNFDNELFSTGINAGIRACVDFSAYSGPYLDFDMVSFRSDSAVAESYEYSSMLRVKWEGNDVGGDVIHGQTEGEKVHHGYQLPPNFKGELTMLFYTAYGGYPTSAANYDSDDFVLLDNLQLHTDFVGTSEARYAQLVQITPNPAHSSVAIWSSEAIKNIELQSVNGQHIRQVDVAANHCDLDLQGLQNGLYVLHVQFENGQRAVQKLVKLE